MSCENDYYHFCIYCIYVTILVTYFLCDFSNVWYYFSSLRTIIQCICLCFSAPPAQNRSVFDCFGARDCVIICFYGLVLLQKTIFDTIERAGVQKTLSENHRKELQFRRIPLRSIQVWHRGGSVDLREHTPCSWPSWRRGALAPQHPPQQGPKGGVTWTSG